MEKQGKFFHNLILKGIEYYERNVSNQLIEFLYYYITETV